MTKTLLPPKGTNRYLAYYDYVNVTLPKRLARQASLRAARKENTNEQQRISESISNRAEDEDTISSCSDKH